MDDLCMPLNKDRHDSAYKCQGALDRGDDGPNLLRCAVLGCGMMGREHLSYLLGYGVTQPNLPVIRLDFLCDPHQESVQQALNVVEDFHCQNRHHTSPQGENPPSVSTIQHKPLVLRDEEELYNYVEEIDLLVVATPNYLHTDTLKRWAEHNLFILLEKPACVSWSQHNELHHLVQKLDKNEQEPRTGLELKRRARVWVAMEYRYIPAIAKLVQLLPTIGPIKMCTIRENRFPFLHKVGAWNRDPAKTGDTLVEKWYAHAGLSESDPALRSSFSHTFGFQSFNVILMIYFCSCHFFDLMRLITNQEANFDHIRAIAQRGINYGDEEVGDLPIIDSAYVFLDFSPKQGNVNECEGSKARPKQHGHTMGCLELCMYADGSRHQEEIIVTGTHGRLEAYLPENKVYAYRRPTLKEWSDRSVPPPVLFETVYDCSNVQEVHGISNFDGKADGRGLDSDGGSHSIPTHSGYHYSSTAIEWYRLLEAISHYYSSGGEWKPAVSLEDGIRAVEIGLKATEAIVNGV